MAELSSTTEDDQLNKTTESDSKSIENAVSSNKSWQCGTLTYTFAGLVALFFWLLLGDFALYLRERSISPVASLFLKTRGASDSIIGLLITSMPLLLAMGLGPIVSYNSDRHRGSWGRRIPYLLIPTPIAALAMIGIAFSPDISEFLFHLNHHQTAQDLLAQYVQSNKLNSLDAINIFLLEAMPYQAKVNQCTLVVFAIFWTIFEVAAITSISIFGGLVNDVVPSSLLGRFYGMFRAVSLIDSIIFNYFLFGLAQQYYFEMFIAIAVIFGVGFSLMCMMVKEGDYPPVHEINGNHPVRRGFFLSAMNYFRECFSNPYYLLFFLAIAVGQAGFTPVWTFLIFWAQQFGLTAQDYGRIHATCTIGSLILTIPLGFLADKYHPLRMAIVMMSLHFVVTTLGAILVHSQNSFIISMVCQTLVCSGYLTVTASIQQRLLPKSRFTEYFSAGTLMTSLLGIIFAPAEGLILDHTNHNYRLTFVICSFTAIISVILFILVYRRFLQLGGQKNYLAPGDYLADTSVMSVASNTGSNSTS